MKLTVGSLFSGIGGFDLGLERTGGFEIKWQVEIDDYCRRVLAKHWPDVRRYEDVRQISQCFEHQWQWDQFYGCGPGFVPYQPVQRVDVLCGGFPCQPVSLAGDRKGQMDDRWLWPEFERIVRLVRPRYVLVENTPGLLSLGMGDVLGGLASCGYDAEWAVISASDVGAPHLRERVWIIAYPVQQRYGKQESAGTTASYQEWNDPTYRQGWQPIADSSEPARKTPNADRARLQVATCSEFGVFSSAATASSWREFSRAVATGRHSWSVEPAVGRVADGIPNRVDRLKGLGNAIVPQVVEWIGRQILAFESSREVSS